MILLFSEQDRIILNRVDNTIKRYWFLRRTEERKKENRIIRLKPNIKVFR